MKIAAILALAGSAAAFAPTTQKASSTTLSAFKDELGAMQPLGYWDPLGICKDGDADKFNRLRYVCVTV